MLTILAGCAQQNNQPPVQQLPLNTSHSSDNQNGRVRLLVLHYTSINWEQSLRALTVSKDRPVSAHYLVPERFDETYPAEQPLQIYQLVSEDKRAWHAGNSRWEDRDLLNDSSIGIEIVNLGNCFGAPEQAADSPSTPLCFSPDYDPAQLELVAQLTKDILRRHPDISPTRVVGHSDIAPARKQDPGTRFPWQWLAKQGIGAWYDDATVLKYWQGLASLPSVRQVQQALATYGYGITVSGELDEQTRLYLTAFQRHFMPERVHGNIDRHTVAVLWALLEKYFPQSVVVDTPLALPLTLSQ